jgi:TRAP transporter 4TM/12TM fusion protein
MTKGKGLGLGVLFSVGARRRPTGWLGMLITPLAVALAFWVIAAAAFIVIQPWTLSIVFLSGMMTLAFLTVGATPSSGPRPTLLDWTLSLASAAVGVYFTLHAGLIEHRIVLLDPLTEWDLVFGWALIVLTLEITRRTTGLGLMLVVLVFIAYNLLGHRLDGVLKHGYIDLQHFVEITVFTTDGILGLPVRVAATYAFLFVLFGTVLMYAKGGDFFYDFAAALSGRQPGGPAKIAVVSSGLYGMVSGSPTSDVVTTGSITIPIMKRLGYDGALAGAVEVSASTGGSLMPPVMGSAAFLMAEYTGLDYSAIAVSALFPALLYYLSIFAQVHFRSLKLGLQPLAEDAIPRVVPTLKSGGLFLIPLAVLTVVLLVGYTPTLVAVIGTASILAVVMLRVEGGVALTGDVRRLAETAFRSIPLVVLVVGLAIETPLHWLAVAVTGSAFLVALVRRFLLRRKIKIGLIDGYRALADTAARMIPVAGACAAAGLVIGGITMTGLAAKFAHVVYGMTDAQVFPALLVAAALTIVLGLGMPTPSAYILAALLMGPLMLQLKMPLMGSHMFLLYFAVMSAITPPVAVAAYAASSIAEDNPIHIAALAVKFSLAAFLVPFAFIYQPGLLLEGTWYQVVIACVTAGFGVLLLALAAEGHWRAPVPWWGRIALAAAGLSFLSHSVEAMVAAAVVVAALWFVPVSGLRRIA